MTIKLDHINLTVENLKVSIEWYRKVFGFELVESGINSEDKNWGIIASNDSMICMAEYPNRAQAKKYETPTFHKIYHFGLRISDRNEWEKTLKEQNLKLNYGGLNEYPHSVSWYIQDPSGHEIEVSYSHGEPMKFPQRDSK